MYLANGYKRRPFTDLRTLCTNKIVRYTYYSVSRKSETHVAAVSRTCHEYYYHAKMKRMWSALALLTCFDCRGRRRRLRVDGRGGVARPLRHPYPGPRPGPRPPCGNGNGLLVYSASRKGR